MTNDTIEFPALSVPILEERPWAVFAACREAEPELFFGGSKDAEEAALAICAICTVRRECLEHALETRERFGVWGGETEQGRKRLLRAGDR
jgi:WhiB family transcriptional regulator, redox-sensing transcriptional regulator